MTFPPVCFDTLSTALPWREGGCLRDEFGQCPSFLFPFSLGRFPDACVLMSAFVCQRHFQKLPNFFRQRGQVFHVRFQCIFVQETLPACLMNGRGDISHSSVSTYGRMNFSTRLILAHSINPLTSRAALDI